MQLIKWFWTSLNLRNWTFEGNALVRPDHILRRLITLPFLFLFKYLYLFFVLLGWGYEEAKSSYLDF